VGGTWVERNSSLLWDENLNQFRPIDHDTAYEERCMKTNAYAAQLQMILFDHLLKYVYGV